MADGDRLAREATALGAMGENVWHSTNYRPLAGER
jgi:hypothetical protein